MGFGLRDIFAAYERLGDAVWRGVMSGNALRIVEEDGNRLALKTARGLFTLDANLRTIRRKDRLVARFGEISRVLLRTISVDENNDMWSVSLEKADGGLVDLGRSIDDVEASIAAAHLARLIGVGVDAVR